MEKINKPNHAINWACALLIGFAMASFLVSIITALTGAVSHDPNCKYHIHASRKF
jgi:hypothetical protein